MTAIDNNIKKDEGQFMKVTALLTGRGNNTLQDKNILDVLGHPVLYYPAHAARKVSLISNFYCSSDDKKILDAAGDEGYESIVRPEYLARATSQHVDVIKHGIDFIKKKDDLGDILVVLLANNVTVKSEWIEICIKMMMDDMTISAVVPVYKDNDHHPLRGKKVGNNQRLQTFKLMEDEPISTNRQDLTPCYFLSHNFWVLNIGKMLESNYKGQKPWEFMGENIAYYEIDESIDIHKEIDVLIAKEWIKTNYTD